MPIKKSVSLKSLGIKHIDKAMGIEEFALKNGLKILLRENHSAPVVSFMVVYRVGSRNEAVGYTGSTHFLEHMMFKGTRKFNPALGTGVMETFNRVGALLNATTWLDRTNYFECLPAEYLELCIEVEADRMRNLLLRQADRDAEMTVVRNEFERGENQPISALSKELSALAFREHPYHHPTIGWRSDVEGVPLSRLKEFYDTFYWPNNATVIVVGDFNTDSTLRLIHKYFAKIPSSPVPIPDVYTHEPAQEGERRFVLKRAGDLPQLMMAYHTPEASHNDTYALSALHAVLGDAGKRSSRLYKALMETRLASSCYSSNGEFKDPHLFSIGATLAPEKTFDELEKAIYEELDKLKKELVTSEELFRAKQANRKGTVLASADPQNFANMLCIAESVDTWRWLVEYDDKFDAVQPEDIKRVACKYFNEENRTVGHFIPTNEDKRGLELVQPQTKISESIENGKKKSLRNGNHKNVSSAKNNILDKKINLKKIDAYNSSFKTKVLKEELPNGLKLLVMNNPLTGSVAINGAIPAGDYFASAEYSMMPTCVASMLTRGSKNYAKVELAKILEEMGVRFGFGSDRYKVSFGTLLTKEDFRSFLPILKDLILNPTFAESELTLLSQELKAALIRASNDTSRRASNLLMQTIFPEDHPFYEKSYELRLAELDNISSEMLTQFHKDNYGPRGSVISVVGDFDAQEVMALLKDYFADWHESKINANDKTRVPVVPEVTIQSKKSVKKEIDLQDKANVDIFIGCPSVLHRKNKDFFAAQLANAALGKDSISSRLGKIIRVKHGLSYGIHSYFEDTSFGSAPWIVSFSVNPSNVSKALALVDEVIDDYLKKGISTAELEAEAGRAVGSFLVSLRSSDGIASALTRFEYIGLGVEAMDTIAADFMSVTRKDVEAALKKYFHADNFVTVLAGTMARVN